MWIDITIHIAFYCLYLPISTAWVRFFFLFFLNIYRFLLRLFQIFIIHISQIHLFYIRHATPLKSLTSQYKQKTHLTIETGLLLLIIFQHLHLITSKNKPTSLNKEAYKPKIPILICNYLFLHLNKIFLNVFIIIHTHFFLSK